jgi:hypothetical protein
MKKSLLFLLLFACCLPGQAQQSDASNTQIGIELDALPYITGGYFAAAWVGKDHWRLRALTAGVNKPDWVTEKGFTNHHVTAYALVVDYFLKPEYQGWWIAGGPVYWKSTIQTDAKLQTTHFDNLLLNGSLGYNWKFFHRFYLSPWAGMSIRVSGDKGIPVDSKTFTLPLFNPEASLKLGFYF